MKKNVFVLCVLSVVCVWACGAGKNGRSLWRLPLNAFKIIVSVTHCSILSPFLCRLHTQDDETNIQRYLLGSESVCLFARRSFRKRICDIII